MKRSNVVSINTTSATARRKDAYDNMVANIRPLSTYGRGRSQRTITGSVVAPLSLLYVDERYQGLRTHKQLAKLDKNFDIRKLAPIVIVLHPEEYRCAIVDGQGRYLVAPNHGMDALNAIVLMDAPDDPEERLKFEAEYFIGQDSEVERVKPLEKHLSRVIIGDKPAVLLEKMFKKYGIRYVSTQGNRGESVLGSYTDTYAIAKQHGEKCLEFIFGIIQNAGWDNESNGYATFVMRALRDAWIAHPADRRKIHTYLSKNLREIDPSLLSSQARSKYPKRDTRSGCTLLVEDMICDDLGIERRLYFDDKKNCKIIK